MDATEQITIIIDDEVIGGGSFSTAAVIDFDFQNLDQWFADGNRCIQFRFGDSDRTTPFGSYYVDNISVYSNTAGIVCVFEVDFTVYSSDSGNEVQVFTDNFETNTVGISFYPNANTADTTPIPNAIIKANTPYTSNSFEVVVGER